ncbi:SITS-binding protein-like [Bacillus rossius redtenbacheri]|uniref:SITS-binding protein-like n=1 Tax=Bacillus rossius redtenbacheri TaxID=93214 RepID=UPI002FDD34F7
MEASIPFTYASSSAQPGAVIQHAAWTEKFLLGEEILVAPVLVQGATSRDVYLPQGSWREGLHPANKLIQGRAWLRNYTAALDELPYFIRQQ